MGLKYSAVGSCNEEGKNQKHCNAVYESSPTYTE